MAKNIFTRGEFKSYKIESVTESLNFSKIKDSQKENLTTIFISYKHDELEDVKDLIGFLEKNYKVRCYIDCEDSLMPKKTSAETANRIKEKINECDKFILLATNGAINSKWCNWELGYGDAKKFEKNIAIMAFKDTNKDYEGNEYMQIYPTIREYTAGEKYQDGSAILPGYYFVKLVNGVNRITELGKWFSNK